MILDIKVKEIIGGNRQIIKQAVKLFLKLKKRRIEVLKEIHIFHCCKAILCQGVYVKQRFNVMEATV